MANGFTSDYSWAKYWGAGPAELENALTESATIQYPVRDLADMTEAEITSLEARYNCTVIRPNPMPKILRSP